MSFGFFLLRDGMKSCREGVLFGGTFIFSGKYLLCTGLRSVLSKYFPEKTKPSERRKTNQNHPKKEKEAEKEHQKHTRKRTPKLEAKGPSQKSHEPSIAIEDDLAIFKLDR